MAHATRPDRRKAEFWKHQRPRHLLCGLMKCGACGANYTKHGASRFTCARARDRATCTNHFTVRGDDVENAILQGLKCRLMEPALFEEFALIAEINRNRAEASSAKAAMQSELERVKRQIKRLVDAILDGADALAINTKLKQLEAENLRSTSTLELSPLEEPLLHPNLAVIYRDRVEGLGALFRDPDRGREAFDLLRSLIDEVRLLPEERGEYRIELRGQLAGILPLAQGAKNSKGTAVQKALQIKMVAGARLSFGNHGLPSGFRPERARRSARLIRFARADFGKFSSAGQVRVELRRRDGTPMLALQ